jgi:hypothetical protein
MSASIIAHKDLKLNQTYSSAFNSFSFPQKPMRENYIFSVLIRCSWHFLTNSRICLVDRGFQTNWMEISSRNTGTIVRYSTVLPVLFIRINLMDFMTTNPKLKSHSIEHCEIRGHSAWLLKNQKTWPIPFANLKMQSKIWRPKRCTAFRSTIPAIKMHEWSNFNFSKARIFGSPQHWHPDLALFPKSAKYLRNHDVQWSNAWRQEKWTCCVWK